MGDEISQLGFHFRVKFGFDIKIVFNLFPEILFKSLDFERFFRFPLSLIRGNIGSKLSIIHIIFISLKGGIKGGLIIVRLGFRVLILE
jgi:hypothetical protein